MLDYKFFFKLQDDVVPMFRKHTFMKALDVFGKPFKKYSAAYEKSKKAGKIFRQASEFKDSRAPVLTSDLLKDWKLWGTTLTGFKFGTMDFGGTVESLANKGRVISSEKKPLPDHISRFIMKRANSYVTKKLGKIKGKKININIGK